MDLAKLFHRKSDAETQEAAAEEHPRLPPGQYLTTKWPVLSYERTPRHNPEKWRFTVSGLVEEPFQLTWAEFLELPRVTLTADFHCVTTWSRYDNTWEGAHIRTILERAKPRPEAKFVSVHSWSGYTTNLPLADLDDDDVLIALKHDGKDLEPDHGGPVRLIVPKLYAYKSAKWLDGLEFLAKDQPGFWEVRGYHNRADPWKEERYW